MNLFWIPRLLNGKAFHRLEIERRTNSGSDARYSVLYLAFPALTCWTNHTPSSPLKPPQLWALDRRPGMFLGVRKPFIWSSGFLLEHSGKTLLSKLRSRAGRLRIWSVTRCTSFFRLPRRGWDLLRFCVMCFATNPIKWMAVILHSQWVETSCTQFKLFFLSSVVLPAQVFLAFVSQHLIYYLCSCLYLINCGTYCGISHFVVAFIICTF